MILGYNEYLNEQHEQTEYIDFNKTNMEEDFNYLNKLMFNNEVKPVKFKWFKSKHKIGLASFKGGDTISISNFYKMTRKQYLSVLAHEMIHMYIHHYDLKDSGDHGWQFKKIMNQLNKDHTDFEIKPSEDASYYSVNSNIKKPLGVVLFIYNGGEEINTDYEAIYVNKQVINNDDILNTFVENLISYNEKSPLSVFTKYRSVTMEFYKCDNPDLSQFKLKRNLNLTGMGFYGVGGGELMKIREGELFNTIKLK